LLHSATDETHLRRSTLSPPPAGAPRRDPPGYRLGLDRRRKPTLREQARQAVIRAIRARRDGFRRGQRFTTLALARANPIHRNTLTHAMDDLVRLGYLRRIPNHGFEVVDRTPDRPARLTRHVLSLSDVAERSGLQSRSTLVDPECGERRAGDLPARLRRARAELGLAAADRVWVLTRCRWVRSAASRRWVLAALVQSVLPKTLAPDFLATALAEIGGRGEFSLYRYLQRAFPRDEFFKAQYEIALEALPEPLAACWTSAAPPVKVLNVTYGSQGALEFTQTWFDPRRAVLLAGSLDVRVGSSHPAPGGAAQEATRIHRKTPRPRRGQGAVEIS
jgi:DNA-binding GntR family transcriptional regulator